MLVGAGGNAGNQSAIKIIRALATNEIEPTSAGFRAALQQQLVVALGLGVVLTSVGAVRVLLTDGDMYNCLAISASLFCIVFISVILGTVLPFGLNKLGVDPANAGTTIQVLMDIMGVTITCLICTLVLDSGFVALPFD
mmetsp:Transcript_10836/g.39767  ORF Transcript_10836/g.39767 Transcript_10836/m.39767 type:complete len:139 (+) Transcript_10836:46-462(+)